MDRPVRPVVVLACIAALAACGLESSRSSGAAAVSAAAAPLAAAPATCGSGPLDSSLALRSRGGGCTPFGIAAALADPANPADFENVLQRLVAVNPEWAPVVNGGAGPESTPVLVHGTVIDSQLSTTDFPSTHVSIDQNTDILLDDEDRGCAATGNATAELGGVGAIREPHIELEWEADRYPAWAWGGPGDRIVALGRWIFDCGHADPVPGVCHGTADLCILDADCGAGVSCDGVVFNYRSELHPPQATAVIRGGRGSAMLTSGHQSPVTPTPFTRADVFVSGDGGGAGDACVLTPVGVPPLEALFAQNCFPFSQPLAPINSFDFEFDVDLPVPHQGNVPIWNVLEQADHAPAVPADVRIEPVLGGPGKPHLHVTVLMTKPVNGTMPTGYASTIFAGWREPNALPVQHVRVTIDGIDIRDPLAHVTPVPLPNPGTWRVQASVNNEWQRFADVPAAVGFHQADLVYHQWLLPDDRLTVRAQAESQGCEDFVRGQPLGQIVGFFTQAAGGDPLLGLQLAGACDFDVEIDDGEIDAAFPGPQFGVQAAPYVVQSTKGAWALRFRVERVEGP
jgi:hypothetical protein